jgi:hypothetical protein
MSCVENVVVFMQSTEIQKNSAFHCKFLQTVCFSKVYKEPCGRFSKQENQNGFQKSFCIAIRARVSEMMNVSVSYSITSNKRLCFHQ